MLHHYYAVLFFREKAAQLLTFVFESPQQKEFNSRSILFFEDQPLVMGLRCVAMIYPVIGIKYVGLEFLRSC